MTMNASASSKWIDNVSVDDRPEAVAVVALRSRFKAVLRELPKAAKNTKGNSKAVHQLRVWTRRATAALRLYAEFLPEKDVAWLKKRLKRIRHAANDARDCDVLIEHLSGRRSSAHAEHWLQHVAAEREAAQHKIVEVYNDLIPNRKLKKRVDSLLKKLATPAQESKPETALFGLWSRQQLRPFVDDFFAAVPTDFNDESALHQFRIQGKHLRYAMELLVAAFPASFRTRLYPTIESLQDRLGKINDIRGLKARLQKKIEHAPDADSAAVSRQQLAKYEARQQQNLKSFQAWWTPKRAASLRQTFEKLL
ncbi:CHAD domain-containing protein [Planctomicrobium piriforme]|uniref:CHAD domain-containing protein n=1 Tax=Planctomicrobium piriforme TaxID=1576369 RepID=A0A1I3KXY5_9PLAN|nr:CHAD domain-containing protein [Planctomicrobium piriforme]SFI77401.1 CHAD domain-containing protein [Planctomicrobium piriforme]